MSRTREDRKENPNCPECAIANTIEEAYQDAEDNDWFCITCGGLFTEQEMEEA